jgi:hypothetical protein
MTVSDLEGAVKGYYSVQVSNVVQSSLPVDSTWREPWGIDFLILTL